MQDLKIKITFTEEVLGTASNDPNIHGEYIASKAPDAKSVTEEIEAVGIDGVIEKGMTVFPRDENGKPFLYDYQIKGFFKDAAGVLRKVKDTKASKVKAYKKEIDGLVFVSPRKILLNTQDKPLGDCQRPLRASGPQGERVAISHSETAPEGTTIECTIACYSPNCITYKCYGSNADCYNGPYPKRN